MKTTLIATLLALAPIGAFAIPVVGDVVGTNPAEATAALAAKGCAVEEFEAEDGKIEAKCHDAAKALWEVYIDPKTGAVLQVKNGD